MGEDVASKYRAIGINLTAVILHYRVTKVLGDKLSIQGWNGCYIGPESRVCPEYFCHPVVR